MKFLLLSLVALEFVAAQTPPPDADAYGAAEHYPVGTAQNFFEQKYMVGSFSHFDSIFPAVAVAPAARPWEFAKGEIDSRMQERIATYLSKVPVTGLLIAKDDQILFEGYQYDRTANDLLTSQSMSKTIVAMLAGIALPSDAVGRTVGEYVPALKGSPYGAVTVQNVLAMSSGVTCQISEGDLDKDSLNAIAHGCKQEAPQGTRFRYSGMDAQVLGFVVSATARASLAEDLQAKIWQQIGTQSKATWAVDKAGHETAYCCLNATLRDYARLGRLLANYGNWNGKQLIPKQWILDATTVPAAAPYLAPGNPAPFYGYGYQVWIFPGAKRMFALLGAHGQRIFVDPQSKLLLVQTAVMEKEIDPLRDAETIHLWRALVNRYATGS